MMADGTPDSGTVTRPTEQEPSPSSSVELKYPTINLRTSYESLLSNSTISANTNPTMTRSQYPAMDDSWAALQPSDYSNDEDQQSDIIDTGSLIDLSSAHDTESVVGDETRSEPDLEAEDDELAIDTQPFVQKELDLNQSQAHEDDLAEDTIILQKSEVQPCESSIDMEYTIHSAQNSRVNGSSLAHKAQIIMTVSTSLLKKEDKPFHVAYYGSPEDSDMKEELLGKIGAAVVLPKALDHSSSSLYNIVPTEFGPGSKPTFAGLMPSHAQMSVEDIKLIPTDSQHLQIVSRRGVVFDSDTTQSTEWRPDLLIVHIDRRATAEDSLLIERVIKLTAIHAWPTVIVTQDASRGLCSQAPGSIAKILEFHVNGTLTKVSQAIDLDSFIVIDTEQINKHLKFLAERSEAHHSKLSRLSSVQRLWKLVQDCIHLKHSNAPAAQLVHEKQKRNVDASADLTQRHQQKKDDTSQHMSEQQLHAIVGSPPESREEELKQDAFSHIRATWRFATGRQTLKDTVLSLAVLILGLYIVRFSQGLTQSTVTGLQGNASSITTTSQPTIQATASVSVAPDTPSNVPSIDQDVMVYEPISFDQVWSRLTGKSPDPEEKKAIDEALDTENISRNKATSEEELIVEGPPKTVTNSLMYVLNNSRNALERLVTRLETKMASLEAGMQLKKEQQAQIEEMNQKILDFWAEIPQSLRLASKHSNERYQELVRKSQKHIRRARWATDKRMGELVKEQKKLLSRAQLQAQLLTRDMPRRKRGAIFRKGGVKYGFWR